jgi:5-methyltetrahydropteroyltriglutamate--homocysteine methyltransferase
VLLPTTIVGSYPQPDWLIDRQQLTSQLPPRVRARDLWRVAEPLLAEALDDATVVAIKAQEDAGVDIISDGEIRRESYSNQFATALEGIDLDNPGTVISRSGQRVTVPRVVGRIRRRHPVEVQNVRFLRARTRKSIKVTVPGPFTMSQQAQLDFYSSRDAAAIDYAAAVNEEIRDLFAAGADIVQVDEPYLQARPDEARRYGVEVLNRALHGIAGTTCIHLCFGYAALVHDRPAAYSFLTELSSCRCDMISIETAQSKLDCSVLAQLPDKQIMLGVIDLSDSAVESAETVAARIRRALPFVAPERLIVATDCGMKYLPRATADGKMHAMVAGARIVRGELVASQ